MSMSNDDSVTWPPDNTKIWPIKLYNALSVKNLKKKKSSKLQLTHICFVIQKQVQLFQIVTFHVIHKPTVSFKLYKKKQEQLVDILEYF